MHKKIWIQSGSYDKNMSSNFPQRIHFSLQYMLEIRNARNMNWNILAQNIGVLNQAFPRNMGKHGTNSLRNDEMVSSSIIVLLCILTRASCNLLLVRIHVKNLIVIHHSNPSVICCIAVFSTIKYSRLSN